MTFQNLVWKYFIDIQTIKELVQMDVNKMMTNGVFTMNGKHTQSKHLYSML